MPRNRKKYISQFDHSLLNIGALLYDYLKKKRIHKSVLARILTVNDSTLRYYQKKQHFNTGILELLCHGLKHNFFQDIADAFPESYTVTKEPDTSKEEEITALKRQIEILEAEKEILLKAMRG